MPLMLVIILTVGLSRPIPLEHVEIPAGSVETYPEGQSDGDRTRSWLDDTQSRNRRLAQQQEEQERWAQRSVLLVPPASLVLILLSLLIAAKRGMSLSRFMANGAAGLVGAIAALGLTGLVGVVLDFALLRSSNTETFVLPSLLLLIFLGLPIVLIAVPVGVQLAEWRRASLWPGWGRLFGSLLCSVAAGFTYLAASGFLAGAQGPFFDGIIAIMATPLVIAGIASVLACAVGGFAFAGARVDS